MRQTGACLVAFFVLAARAAAQVPDHLECYKIKDSAPRTTYTADLAGLAAEPGCQVKVPAKLLCVATTKSNVSPTPPGALGDGSPVGRYLCYKVKCPKGAPDALTVGDQFGSRSVQPVIPKVLCAPELSAVCGNGVVDDGEVCDDGNTTTEEQCPYGTQTCNGCDATCGTVLTLAGPTCGDGSLDGPEVCDDGNVSTETECPYNEAPCTGCDSTCSTNLNLTGPSCGDGSVDFLFEDCDDNNTSSCGTCNANCRVLQLSSATGFILAVEGVSLTDGETFSLASGFFGSALFEFDTAFDGVASGNVEIPVLAAWSAAQVAEAITSQINNALFFVLSASRQSNLVSLTSVIQGSPGNQPIVETVSDPDFVVTGMQGGDGRNCESGVGCGSSQDCASGECGFQVPGECD